jgi:maltooligosyltrehalose trehalohydrolase
MTHQNMFGPSLLPGGRAKFRLWAPSVETVSLKIGAALPVAMRRGPNGWFEAAALAQPGAEYGFFLPGGMAVPDPAAREQSQDVHGASLLADPQAYCWQTENWQNRPWHEAVIYELHPGAFGGFNGIKSQLARLAQLGITAVELMPIADFPGQRNWGYDGVLPYAPARAYGTPDELKAMIDAAHGEGLMVFLDVVYNHFGPDGAYLHTYAHDFFDEGVHTPWGAAIDFKRPEVQTFFIENALMWVNEFRFDGLRFDAVHAISPETFLPQLAAAIRDGTDHPVHLILEHEGNKAGLLQGPGAKLFDAQWADDWHHCLHVLLTGEREGYYESFANPAEQLARAMSEGFVFQGEISPHHNAPRGEPSGHLPPTAFVICLQNHDQIGNRALGERLTTLAHPDALAAATALLLLSPTIPMLFMGEEFSAQTPFLFFTDHGEELAGLIREGRRREFAHFAAFKDEARRAQIPDPNAPGTFANSVPDFSLATNEQATELHRKLLALRRMHITPGIPGCRSVGAAAIGAQAVCGGWHLGIGTRLTLAANFGETPIALPEMAGTLIYSSGASSATGLLGAHSFRATLAAAV